MRTYNKYAKLSNGYYLAMYMTRYRLNRSDTSWIVAICVCETKKKCDYWFRHQDQTLAKQQNVWGMEAIMKALDWLRELEQKIPQGDSVVIYWIDKRRYSAFRYLKRYGYVESTFLSEPCFIWKKLE